MNKRQRRKLAKQHGFGYFMVVSLDDAAQGRMSINITPIDYRWVVKRGRQVYVKFPESQAVPAKSIGQFFWGLPSNGSIHVPYVKPDGTHGRIHATIRDRMIATQRMWEVDVVSILI